LIVGADAALGIPTWHRWEEVVDRAGILVVPRVGTDMNVVERLLPSALALEMSVLEISATEIREAARAGGAYRFLVPLPVFDFIEATGLYAETAQDDRVGASDEQEESP
jgi:nicotinate-nucleotide adenylyltransferase